MSFVIFACFIVFMLYEIYHFIYGKPPNTPPGIPRLPILGSYPFLLWSNYRFPHKAVEHYVKKYKSKLISYYAGNLFAIIANDYHSIKEILKREDFDGRISDIDVFKARAFGKSLGIFFTENNLWHEQRRFALRHMRDFGFGRRQEKIEADIMEELSIFVDTIKSGPINNEENIVIRGNSVLFPDVLFPLCANSIWVIMIGEKLDRNEHHKLRSVCRFGMTFQRAADTSGGAIALVPSLKYFGNLFGYANIMKGNYGMVDFVKEYVDKFKTNFDERNDRGFIDRYLKRLQNEMPGSTFSEEQLLIMLVDIIFPALTALPTVVTHCIKYCMHNPKVMKKLQEEIDTIVGSGRLVNWEDRHLLTYTEATVRETLRIETLTPFSVFHKNKQKTTLQGYTIPANTVVITNLAAMNHDPEFWGDPENFRPERFLDEDGKLIKDYSLPFGFGHRVCVGETFARFMLFNIVAVLIQNFTFHFIEGQPTDITDTLPGLIVTPRDTYIRMESR